MNIHRWSITFKLVDRDSLTLKLILTQLAATVTQEPLLSLVFEISLSINISCSVLAVVEDEDDKFRSSRTMLKQHVTIRLTPKQAAPVIFYAVVQLEVRWTRGKRRGIYMAPV